MSELADVCTCPHDDWWACIDGGVYGPCESEHCYGVCQYEGLCNCPLHETFEHDGISNWEWNFKTKQYEFQPTI